MFGRGFTLRRVILVAFVVFAILSLGSVYFGHYKATGQSSNPVPSPQVFQQTPQPTTPSSSPSKASPTSASTSVPSSTASPTATQNTRPSPTTTPIPQTPTPGTSALDLLVLVDKQSPLPASYVPPDLVTLTTVHAIDANQKIRRIILPYLEKLMADAKTAGFDLAVSSSYRSYSEQESVHAYWEKTLGKAEADRVSAVAGYSEHQLGVALDMTSASVGFALDEKFGSTPEGKWLRDNAYKYGFIISYPEGKESVTGYAYEPWHIRYVGTETAIAVYQKGITLNEYLRSKR